MLGLTGFSEPVAETPSIRLPLAVLFRMDYLTRGINVDVIASRIRLAEIGKRIGLRALKDVSTVVKPETVMEWFRKLVAKNSTGPGKGIDRAPGVRRSIRKSSPKRSRWRVRTRHGGYDRIVGTLRNLGYDISDRTVGNILKSNGVRRSETKIRHPVERIYRKPKKRSGRMRLFHDGGRDSCRD